MKKSSKKTKILFVPTLSSVISYYRMEQFVTQMRLDNPDFDIFYTYHDYKYTETCKWEWNLRDKEVLDTFDQLMYQADVAIFQSIHTQEAAALVQCLKDKYGKPILAEFDDDPYSVSSDHPFYKDIAPGSRAELWSHDLVNMADHLIVSTDYLKNIFKDKVNGKQISVIPNALNFKKWFELPPSRKTKKDLIYIGWAGGANHRNDLELLEEPIFKILERFNNVRFVMFCGGEIPVKFRKKNIIRYDFKHWKSINEYPEFMKSLQFDIGVCPLRDSYFNRAKSNLKWLEYSALGIPTVASNVESYRYSSINLLIFQKQLK